jgi:hypothetical protein
LKSAPTPAAADGRPASAVDIIEMVIEVKRKTFVVLYIVVLIAVVVSVDLLFFRNQTSGRLIANIGIVLVFVAFYWRFLKKP